jgi:hypothetical protein
VIIVQAFLVQHVRVQCYRDLNNVEEVLLFIAVEPLKGGICCDLQLVVRSIHVQVPLDIIQEAPVGFNILLFFVAAREATRPAVAQLVPCPVSRFVALVGANEDCCGPKPSGRKAAWLRARFPDDISRGIFWQQSATKEIWQFGSTSRAEFRT